ncbi:precorrin-3B C(17)-methyltransferase [Litorilinea aerophila]|uniref:Precorrin-3B C(17)-methyltransferase n=1 Tax=Litorilinea aerophila TaxID=1204385 RepID=A0A540VFF2_9CHLR|nr:precorrin-3B C(17)-methyltransferase [Litorilinea aerophila]MCC9076741.1 precorrin-3B C(17)-methyltransferase [Litorilinea aerophila]
MQPTPHCNEGCEESREESRAEGVLFLVSLGPGAHDQMTLAAREAVRRAQVIIGYRGYIEQIRPQLQPWQTVVASPIGQELARAEEAVNRAAAGARVALVSSGDVGIYAMAGPVYDVLRARDWQGDGPRVEVLPGVSAIQAAAARLGAPLSHDFCTISLSDLLTPWPVIQRRIQAAAWGDFVIGFYNPRSRGRDWQLRWAVDCLRQYRSPHTPVAIARQVTRPDEAIQVTTLGQVDVAQVDMFTLVLVGNSQSYLLAGHLATPRGYRDLTAVGNLPGDPGSR